MNSAAKGRERQRLPGVLWLQGAAPYLWAGGPSMMMLIHRICMAFKGFGSPRSCATATKASAAMDVDSWKANEIPDVVEKCIFLQQWRAVAP